LFGGYQRRPIDLLCNLVLVGWSPVSLLASKNKKVIEWFPDIVTTSLILKLSKNDIQQIQQWCSDHKKNGIPAALRKYRKSIQSHVTTAFWPTNIKDGTDICSYLIKYEAPAFLTHDKGYHQQTAEISLVAWKRLCFGIRSKVKGLKRHGYSPKVSIKDLSNMSGRAISREDILAITKVRHWMTRQKTSKIYRSNLIKQLEGELSSINQDETPFAYLILLWISDVLNDGKTASSVQTYLSKIYRPLIDIINVLGIVLPASANDWQLIFDELMSIGAKEGQKSWVSMIVTARSLQSTLCHHGFLHMNDCDDLPYIKANQSNVNANLVSFEEIDLLSAIYSDAGLTRHNLVQQVVVSLGFYCGMRASEIFNLRLRDVERDDVFEIRNHDFGSPKSAYSHRKVSVVSFFPPHQLELFKKLVELRMMESPNNQNVRFIVKLGGAAYKASTMTQEIVEILWGITGDKSIRFHHLRHSFATWTLTRLLSTSYPHLIDRNIRALKHDAFSAEQCKKLAGVLLYDGHKMQFPLSAIRERLGHADESTTLTSYFHLANFFKHKTFSPVIPEIPVKFLSVMMGLSYPAVYKRQQTEGVGSQAMLVESIRRTRNEIKPDYGMIDDRRHFGPTALRTLQWQVFPTWFRILLPVHLKEFQDIYEANGAAYLSKLYMVPEDAVHIWSDLARSIFKRNKKTKPARPNRPLEIKSPTEFNSQKKAIKFIKLMRDPSPKYKRLVYWALKKFYLYGVGLNTEQFHVYLRSVNDTKRFIRFFRYMGFKDANIVLRVVHIHGDILNAEEMENRRIHWAQSCGLPEQFAVIDTHRRSTCDHMGAVYLSLVDRKKLINKRGKVKKTYAGIGGPLHFALETEIRMMMLRNRVKEKHDEKAAIKLMGVI